PDADGDQPSRSPPTWARRVSRCPFGGALDGHGPKQPPGEGWPSTAPTHVLQTDIDLPGSVQLPQSGHPWPGQVGNHPDEPRCPRGHLAQRLGAPPQAWRDTLHPTAAGWALSSPRGDQRAVEMSRRSRVAWTTLRLDRP